MPATEVLQKFFFEAMMHGWAEGVETEPVPEMPGYKRHACKSGDLLLVDMWCTNPNSLGSAGSTTIWQADQALWVMQYQGWYAKQGSAACRAALAQAYSRGFWYGGRGPAFFDHDAMTYRNSAVGGFSDFYGREEVFSRHGPHHLLGEHYYRGMCLTVAG